MLKEVQLEPGFEREIKKSHEEFSPVSKESCAKNLLHHSRPF
jgi:hypothetical protein